MCSDLSIVLNHYKSNQAWQLKQLNIQGKHFKSDSLEFVLPAGVTGSDRHWLVYKAFAVVVNYYGSISQAF